jgi:hypothetical protein
VPWLTQRQIGYADVVTLRSDPQGWARYPCAGRVGPMTLVAARTRCRRPPVAACCSRSMRLAPASRRNNSGGGRGRSGSASLRQPVRGLLDHYLPGHPPTPRSTRVHGMATSSSPEDNLVHPMRAQARRHRREAGSNAAIGGRCYAHQEGSARPTTRRPGAGAVGDDRAVGADQASERISSRMRSNARSWSGFRR